ncbi:MAG: PIN domain-containing protein [Candidatus Micrarchaeota archaeon]
MIDSTILIAHAYVKDENYERALEILPAFIKEKKRHVTDYCILEITNFLLRKSNFKDAKTALETLTNSKQIEIIYNDELSFKATAEIFEKYPGLSFTDANMVFHMQRINLKEILSFDAGFDKVKEIKRTH